MTEKSVDSPCVYPVHAPRELARQQILPETLQLLSVKIGPLVAMYRVDCALLLKFLRAGSELIHIRLADDKECTIDNKDSGRQDDGENIRPSLLNVVPLCTNMECARGCGCRCSHDLGYTRREKKVLTEEWPYGDVLRCHSKHSQHVPRIPEFPLPLNVDRMIADLAAKFNY